MSQRMSVRGMGAALVRISTRLSRSLPVLLRVLAPQYRIQTRTPWSARITDCGARVYQAGRGRRWCCRS